MGDALEIVRPISDRFATLFGLRWILGRLGNDPCDEINIDALMDLPDGLSFRDGRIKFQCRCCDNWSEWPLDIADFDIDDDNNLCGGSPRCCP